MLRAHHRVCLAAFLLDSTVMMAWVATPYFILRQLGGGPAMTGMVGAFQLGAYALGCFAVSGVLARVQHGLACALGGVACFAVCYALIPLLRSPLLCGMLATLALGGLAFVWPALYAWIGAHPDPDLRARHLRLFNLSWSFGFATSPLIAGPLFDTDYRLPFALMVAVCLCIMVLLRSLPDEAAYFGRATREQLEARVEHDRKSEIHLYAAWLATGLANGLAGITRSVYPARLEALFQAGEIRVWADVPLPAWLHVGSVTVYSWLAAALSLTTVACFIWMGAGRFWMHRFGLIVTLQVLAAGSFVVLGSTKSLVVMLAAFVVVGGCAGVAFFASIYYSLANPALKARRAAVNEGVLGLGGFLVSLAMGQAAERMGVGYSLRWVPVLVAGVVVAQYLLIRRQRRGATTPPPTALPVVFSAD